MLPQRCRAEIFLWQKMGVDNRMHPFGPRWPPLLVGGDRRPRALLPPRVVTRPEGTVRTRLDLYNVPPGDAAARHEARCPGTGRESSAEEFSPGFDGVDVGGEG